MSGKTQDWEIPPLNEHPISLNSIAWTAAENGARFDFKAPEATQSDHRALEQEVAYHVRAQAYKQGAITEFLFQVNFSLLIREIDEIDSKIALR